MRLFILFFMLSNVLIADEMRSFKSQKDFKQTLSTVEEFIKGKGLTLFAVVDHSANAQQAGLGLSPNTLFIFGNPRVGTPLMQARPRMGIDLPVKLLIHEDQYNNVIVSYNRPEAVAKKHNIDSQHVSFQKMRKVLGLIEKALK